MSGQCIKNLFILFFHERDIDDPLKEVVYIYSSEYENPLSNKLSGFFVFMRKTKPRFCL